MSASRRKSNSRKSPESNTPAGGGAKKASTGKKAASKKAAAPKKAPEKAPEKASQKKATPKKASTAKGKRGSSANAEEEIIPKSPSAKKTSRKRGKKATPKKAVPEELELLEPIEDDLDELPLLDDADGAVLEPEEDEDMRVRIEVRTPDGSDDEQNVDMVCSVTLKKIKKPDVTDAFGPSLRNLARARGSEMRRQRVLIRFEGDALIPSAIKALVHDTLDPWVPQSVTVQRGYGNEVVLEHALPEVQVTTDQQGDDLHVRLDAGMIDGQDVDAALPAALAKVADLASGCRVDVQWTPPAGSPAPTVDAHRAQIHQTLLQANAARIEIDGELLMDRELEQRIKINDTSSSLALDLEVGESGEHLRALELVLPGLSIPLAHKPVTLKPSTALAGDSLRAVTSLLEHLGATRLTLDGDTPELLLPPMLSTARKGSAVDLHIQPDSRQGRAVSRSFAREIAAVEDDVRGRNVTIHWPGESVDDDVELDCLSALTEHSPDSVTYTFAGANREPVLPMPLTFHTDSTGACIGDLDTDQGKPPELVRAVQRRLRTNRKEIGGQRVVLHVRGQGAVSRTLRRTLRSELDAAATQSVELIDHGDSQFLLPRCLLVKAAGAQTELMVEQGPREPSQVPSAVAAEIDELDLPDNAEITLTTPKDLTTAQVDAMAHALGKKGARRVLGGDGVQLLPALFAQVAVNGEEWQLDAQPSLDPEATEAQLQRELPAILANHRPEGANVTLQWPAGDPSDGPSGRAVDALRQAGVGAIFFDGGDGMPLQVHPAEEPDAVSVDEDLAAAAANVSDAIDEAVAAADDELPLLEADEPELTLLEENDSFAAESASQQAAAAAAPLHSDSPAVAVIGQRRSGPVPMTMLGVSCAANADGIAQALQGLAPSLSNHRVLLVPIDGDQQLDAHARPDLIQGAHRAVGASAEALLVYRTARGRVGHFEVVASRSPELPRGARLADPRIGTPSA